MKQTLLLLLLSLSFTNFAQSPEAFKYQAVVRDAGNTILANQAVGMRFSVQQGSIGGAAVYVETFDATTNAYGLVNIELGSGTVVSGTFSTINWENGPYFIETAVDITGGTTYSVMGTSQLLSVPYALHSKTATNVTNDLINDADSDPNNEIQSLQIAGQDLTISGGNTVVIPTPASNTLDQAYDQGGPGSGRIITVDAGSVELTNATSNGIGLRVTTTNTGVGVISTSSNIANGFSPIQATTNASSTLTSAIIGSSTGGAYGVSGQVESTATSLAGVYGNNLRTTGGYGTYGIGHSGVVGETNYQLGFGVYGSNADAIGPLGNAVGTYGIGYVGVWGDQSDPNGYSVYANGDFGAAGTKAFAIDHPLDPENKYLKHYSIESNEVLNMYRGNAQFDSNGEAEVTMPDYFDAVNANFSYQLTPVGGFAPLFVKEKLTNGKFVIAGGQPGMEVSWSVYAERNDPYLQQHPESKAVEVQKEVWNQGKYLQPDLYNQSDELKIVKPLKTVNDEGDKGTIQKGQNLKK